MSEIRRIAVVGAGFMGTQIALQAAAHGLAATLVEPDAGARENSQATIAAELRRRRQGGELSAGALEEVRRRLRWEPQLEKALDGAALVVEAIPERLPLKRALFARLDRLCAPQTILASNSSSIKIAAIESAVERRDKVLNLHFYGPVWQRPMVELMRGSATSDETVARARAFARQIGVVPLLVRKESTGFIFNRVWRAIKRETLHLVDEGVASHEDVDRAWMIFTGMAMGPFALMDLVGLDVVCDIEEVYYRESGEGRDAPPPLLTGKVARGELGRKTGKGFYTYPDPAFARPGWLEKEGEET